MGKIEKALNRARVRQGKPGAAKTSRPQVAAEVAFRRSADRKYGFFRF
jgi:hypothetical protein